MSVRTVLYAFAIVLLGGGQSAFATANQCRGTITSCDPTKVVAYFDAEGCTAYTAGVALNINGKCTLVRDCTACTSDRHLNSSGLLFFGVGEDLWCYASTCDCNGCTNCADDTTWSAGYGDGIEIKQKRTCDCTVCRVTSTEYRCAANYYGQPNGASTKCTPCPKSGGVQGKSPAGSTSEEQCCLPGSDVSFDDDKGNGKHKDASCCYKS